MRKCVCVCVCVCACMCVCVNRRRHKYFDLSGDYQQSLVQKHLEPNATRIYNLLSQCRRSMLAHRSPYHPTAGGRCWRIVPPAVDPRCQELPRGRPSAHMACISEDPPSEAVRGSPSSADSAVATPFLPSASGPPARSSGASGGPTSSVAEGSSSPSTRLDLRAPESRAS